MLVGKMRMVHVAPRTESKSPKNKGFCFGNNYPQIIHGSFILVKTIQKQSADAKN
jgi:hypothetical protein